MTSERAEQHIHQAFEIGLALKGVDGVLELVGGLILLFISPAAIDNLAHALTQHELSQDPRDFIATHILHSAGNLTHGATIFAAVYLLSHGVAKLVLIVAVWKKQLWAYPWMISLISAFMLYQIYRIGFNASVGLTLLTIFDAVII